MLKSGKPFIHAQNIYTVERLKSVGLKSSKSQNPYSFSGINIKKNLSLENGIIK